MDFTMADSTTTSQPASNSCGNPSCPRHGKAQVNFPDVSPIKAPSDCGKKNCPKHGDRVNRKSNDAPPMESAQRQTAVNNQAFFTTNNNNLAVAPAPTPVTSPAKFDTSPRAVSYNEMKMQHAIQEAAMLKAITVQQGHEMEELKKQLGDERRYRGQERNLRHAIRADLVLRLAEIEEFKKKLEESENTNTQLKKKLEQTEIAAQKLRRRASENAQTASKWRSKVLAVQEAQKALELKQKEAEKWSTYFAKKVREQHNEMTDLQRQLGVSLAETGVGEALSVTMNTLDTSFIDINEPLTPMREMEN